jgi:hypothetical protein
VDGDWEGFYLAPYDTHKHKMDCVFHFKNQKINGYGSDDVGHFTWSGTYDEDQYKVQLIKSYVGHEVIYQGHADENGIWGKWHIGPWSAGFHLWPKLSGNEVEDIDAEVNEKEERFKLLQS